MPIKINTSIFCINTELHCYRLKSLFSYNDTLKSITFFTLSFIMSILLLSSTFLYEAMAQPGPPEFIPNRYIVVLEDGVSPQDVIRDKGVVPDFVYNHALNGFAGQFSPVSIEKLNQDPRVIFIQQDQKMHIFAHDIPTGIDRMDVETNSIANIDHIDDRVNVDIAILDTGVFDLPGLNVVHSVDCSGGGPFGGSCSPGGSDGHGHGTHVAGTIAALDNGGLVVGVAPGANIWAIKVLDNKGSAYTSWIVGGIDYVTANADQIEVVNMSLGGPGFDDGFCG